MKTSRRGRKPKQPIKAEIITIMDTPDTDTTCSVCYAEFLDPEDLKLHMDQFHVTGSGNLRRCQFCPSVFCDLEDYCRHIRDSHLSLIKCCEYCTRAFTDPDELRKHESKHYSYVKKSMYSCSQCKTLFNNITELEQHEYTKHNNSNEGVVLRDCLPILSSLINIKAETFLQSLGSTNLLYVCIKCEMTTSNVNTYIKHLQKHDCRSYVCDNCSNVFSQKKGLVRHIQNHTECYHNSQDTTEFQCRECHKYFNKSNLKHHLKFCKVLKCITCDLLFESMYELAEHQTKEHPLAIALKTCKYCRKEFVGTALKKHIERTHNEELHLYKYLCVYCDQVYKHPKMLFAHFFSKHRDLQPYMCKICNKKFRVRKRFTIHIKLDHKSVGFVEFDDKFHVFFTDKKSEKPYQPFSIVDNIDLTQNKQDERENQTENEARSSIVEEHRGNLLEMKSTTPKIQSNDRDNEIELVNVNSDFMNPTETEGNVTEVENQEGSKRKRKRKSRNVGRPRKTPKQDINTEALTSDNTDDEPLIVMKKKAKMKRICKLRNATWNRKKRGVVIRDNKKRFTCNICKKYCYTFQNYHHHVSLHFKNEVKKCIKCKQSFKSKSALNQHISIEHSASKLTETLKTLLERRKHGLTEELTTTEKFRRTIKKVNLEKNDNKAILKPIPSKGLSVQKFIENFTPESNETSKKTIRMESSVIMKPVSDYIVKPTTIKMIKFKPALENSDIKLSMPVSFKERKDEVQKVTINLVQKPLVEPKLNLGITPSFKEDAEDVFDNYDQYTEIDTNCFKEVCIPEVAHEVMLEGSEEAPVPKQIPHKILIPELPKEYNEVRIAHLLPEAPYYKIVKVNDILKTQTKQDSVDEEEDVKLPGTKLINVNPLAHLLGNTSMEDILKAQKNKYYKPKTMNFEKAIAKALLRLDNPTAVQKKKFTRKNNVEVEQ